ncbi:kinase-like domain-containing protein [Leptodontidium sp. MPI-SDFR-AT-0119]|nr:kinase-like domain-containing protein [Leptodontidium sp. MPI-SDFR-AT-0119]
MGPSDNRRNTEIDMLAVFEAKAPNHVFERAGSTPRAAPSKKTGSSRGRASEATAGTEQAQSRTAKSATSGPLQLRTAWESPWKKYEKFYDVELGGPVEVAIRKAAPVELVHVRAFVTQAAEKTLHVYRQLQHPNIVTALEAFTTDSGLYIVLEHMPLSLEPIVRSPAYPDARQLAAILGQIITGVAYIAAEGFEHGSLTCSNILLNTDGDVKIANQECCHVKSDGRPRDIRALSSITMELMQKYVKEDGAVGVDDLHRWPSNSDAVGFLSATTSAASAAELLEHPLLSRPHQKESLIGLVSLAQICMRGRYKYTPKE